MKAERLSEKHQFALYCNNLSTLIKQFSLGKSFIITDTNLIHRLLTILRLQIGDSLFLFDQSINAKVNLSGYIKNKSIECVLDEKKNNSVYKPNITFLLPLLKKESLESALYSLVEVGITEIQLITTAKSQQKWTAKEQERAQKIIIAAAEQSKNFAFPFLKAPITLDQLMVKKESAKLFFDPAGMPLQKCLNQIQNSSKFSYILAMGPEGDLTNSEKDILANHEFIFCALTPTILRACQAAALSAGIIRSLV